MNIGARVESGWTAGVGINSAGGGIKYSGPLGTILAFEGTHYRVRWDNGYEAWFPRVELRASSARSRRFKVPYIREEAIAA